MAMNLRSLSRSAITAVAQTLAGSSKEAARALPDSKGGETAKQLQTYSTRIFSYFTPATGLTELLYSAENWVKIKLTLETAGPVAFGDAASLQPMLSGRGIVMDTDKEYEAYLSKGTRIYVISESVNRVSVIIEPIPWLEQLSVQQAANGSAIARVISQASQAIVDAVQSIAPARSAGAAPAQSSNGTTAAQLPPCPPAPVIHRARLTPIRGPGRMR